MIYYCVDCRDEFTDRTSSLAHVQEFPTHFISGIVTKAETVESEAKEQ